MAKQIQVNCKSVFKNTDTILLKDDFNRKIAELINQLEKSKTALRQT